MTYSSLLSDDSTPLVLDTSVLINLDASGFGDRILGAVPNDIHVPERVRAEFELDTSGAKGECPWLETLVDTGIVRVNVLSESELEVFGQLVSGASSLGDGEAATIAVSACRRYLPIIDERKGRREAQLHILGKCPGWSLDLFQHPRALATLGAAAATEALYLALRDGRMRIHEDHCDHVVSLIGFERALECTSLPNYKQRRHQFRMKLNNERLMPVRLAQ